MKELNGMELREVNGGEIAYNQFKWYNGDNELVYAGYAVYNAVCAVSNVGIWIWNNVFGG